MKLWKSLLLVGVSLAALICGAAAAYTPKFNQNAYPEEMIYYLSQWGVYGPTNDSLKGPPFNWMTATASAPGVLVKGDTYIAGSFAGRFFVLDDIVKLKDKFFPPNTRKVVNFSFAGIDMNTCEVRTVDFYADFQVGIGTSGCGAKGEFVWEKASAGEYGHACAIKKLVKQGYEIRLSIGGWTMSTEFSHCTKQKMDDLVNSLQWHKDRYDFTAFDFDWEFPGKQGCGGGGDDPCKFVVSRHLKHAVDYLKTNSSPEIWVHPLNKDYGSNPSYFIPKIESSPGSVDANNDNAEQCHSGDPGVPYRLCNDARLIADWTKWCNECPEPTMTMNNCVIESANNCLKPSYKDCTEHYGHAVTTHPDCAEIAHKVFQTKSGQDETAQYWQTYGFDKAADWKNFVSLLKKVKAKYSMEATVAIGMGSDLLSGTNSPDKAGTSWKEFCDTADAVNVMTYDFYGAWGPPNHNAPLWPKASATGKENYYPEFNVASAVQIILDAGCDAHKVNLGLALYGRTYSKAAQKLGEFGPKGANQSIGVGTYQKGSLSYWDAKARFIKSENGGNCDNDSDMQSAGLPEEIKQCGKWTFERDVEQGCMPYAWRTSGSEFDVITYDDPVSLSLKAKWARCMGLRGLMYWDAADDKKAELSETSWKAWNEVKEADCPKYLKAPTSCDGSDTGGGDTGGDTGGGTGGGTGGDTGGGTGGDTGGGTGGETGGDCAAYKTCVDNCIDCITSGSC